MVSSVWRYRRRRDSAGHLAGMRWQDAGRASANQPVRCCIAQWKCQKMLRASSMALGTSPQYAFPAMVSARSPHRWKCRASMFHRPIGTSAEWVTLPASRCRRGDPARRGDGRGLVPGVMHTRTFTANGSGPCVARLPQQAKAVRADGRRGYVLVHDAFPMGLFPRCESGSRLRWRSQFSSALLGAQGVGMALSRARGPGGGKLHEKGWA